MAVEFGPVKAFGADRALDRQGPSGRPEAAPKPPADLSIRMAPGDAVTLRLSAGQTARISFEDPGQGNRQQPQGGGPVPVAAPVARPDAPSLPGAPGPVRDVPKFDPRTPSLADLKAEAARILPYVMTKNRAVPNEGQGERDARIERELQAGLQRVEGDAAPLREQTGTDPYVHDPVVQDYVARVLDRVATQLPARDRPFRAVILQSDEVQARAQGGGIIEVTTGLLKRVRSEAELAGVFGHELNHEANRDAEAQVAEYAEAGRLFDRYERLGLDPRGLQSTLDGVISGVARQIETQADAGGVRLASRAGYNPWAIVDLLGGLSPDDGTADHPATAQRLAEIGRVIKQENLDRLPWKAEVGNLQVIKDRLGR